MRGVDLDSSFYHVVPRVASPHVHQPVQLAFHVRRRLVVWADKAGELSGQSLVSGPTQTLVPGGSSGWGGVGGGGGLSGWGRSEC